jgi:hypothetical protein
LGGTTGTEVDRGNAEIEVLDQLAQQRAVLEVIRVARLGAIAVGRAGNHLQLLGDGALLLVLHEPVGLPAVESGDDGIAVGRMRIGLHGGSSPDWSMIVLGAVRKESRCIHARLPSVIFLMKVKPRLAHSASCRGVRMPRSPSTGSIQDSRSRSRKFSLLLLAVAANQAKSSRDQVRGLPICVHTPLARR